MNSNKDSPFSSLPSAPIPSQGVTPLPLPKPAGPWLLGWTCPRCGGLEYRGVKSQRYIAFSSDRICLACGTRYSPPTPRWAGVVFMIGGFAIALVCGFFAISVVAEFLHMTWATDPAGRALQRKEIGQAIVMGSISAVTAGAGVLALIHGFRAVFRNGSV